MQSTALIIRPPDAPNIHVLECDGPRDMPYATVHRFPGNNLPGNYLSFEDFDALPDHSKFPGPDMWEIEFGSASRIFRLAQTAEKRGGWMCPEHLQEIRSRMLILFPFCDQQF